MHEIICDADGKPVDYRFLLANPAFERMTGLKSQNIVGKRVLEIMPDTEPYWIAIYGEVALTGQPRSFIQFANDFGKYYEVEAFCPEPGKFAVHFLDCTESIQHKEKIEHMAYHDALTDLPNRYLFRDRLQDMLGKAVRNQERLAVVMLDLDDFKLVNDTLGHFAGDELLKVIGRRATSVLRRGDMIARLGGDEFVLLIEGIGNAESVTMIVEKLRKAIYEPWLYNSVAYHVTCKIGISLFPEDGQDADTLMKHADIAMYRAKELGKGYYQFYLPTMERQVSQRMEIEVELHRAVDNNEFVVYYQPQVDQAGDIVGVEALVRWEHPTRGLVMPMEFIPIAEESGLILKIGTWVLQTACQQAKQWTVAGISPVFMSVNLSAHQFHQQDLLTVVSDIVASSEISPQRLVLEITETVAMGNAEHTIRVLQELKSLGISIALDDFGIGYSSLIYLKRFPVDSIKIDRSFIHDMESNSEGKIIVQTILALTKNLQYIAIAEGVETFEQLEILKELHCDQMQGYLFSKPLPAVEMTQLLQIYSKGGDNNGICPPLEYKQNSGASF